MPERSTGETSTAFPHGLRLRLAADVRRFEGGRVLLGGAPVRVMRLSAPAAGMIEDGALTVTDAATARLAMRLLDAGIAHPDPAELPPIPLAELTVVIPTLGRPRELSALLEHLGGVQIIVVDDGTPEPAAGELAVAVAAAGARLIRLPQNRGPASARNAGLAVVETPFVAFLDSDVDASADQLGLLLRHFADPQLALAGPRVRGIAQDQTWISRYEDARSSLDLGADPALVRPRAPVSWISSTCLIARVDALVSESVSERASDAIGFGEGMRVAEDVDLVWRLHARGLRARYEPRVAVGHRHRSRLREWAARKLFYGTGAAELAAAHPEAIVPAVLRPWSLGVAAALYAGRRWSLPVAAGLTVFAWRRLARRMPGDRGPAHALAARLVLEGLGATWGQLSALALRHWWPLGVLAALLSRRARILIGVMAVADGIIEHRRLAADQPFLPFLIARRIDDLAYGAGVWWGALRRRSIRALLPEVMPRRRR